MRHRWITLGMRHLGAAAEGRPDDLVIPMGPRQLEPFVAEAAGSRHLADAHATE